MSSKAMLAGSCVDRIKVFSPYILTIVSLGMGCHVNKHYIALYYGMKQRYLSIDLVVNIILQRGLQCRLRGFGWSQHW